MNKNGFKLAVIMAYALGFPAEVTNLIYSMRDWKLEEVRRKEGTPSCLAIKPFKLCMHEIRYLIASKQAMKMPMLGKTNQSSKASNFVEFEKFLKVRKLELEAMEQRSV